MKIRKEIQDDEIEGRVREYGMGRLGRKIGVDVSYISHCLAEDFAMEWGIYEKMREELGEKKSRESDEKVSKTDEGVSRKRETSVVKAKDSDEKRSSYKNVVKRGMIY